jgi:hypothetical protein
MDTHVKVLGVLYIALSALGLILALFLMVGVGTAAGLIGAAAEPDEAALAIPIIGIAGTAVIALLLVLCLPGLLAGFGLLKYRPWARILTLVLSVLNLINIPIGTILGVYGLWVLFNKDTERLFTEPSPVVSP